MIIFPQQTLGSVSKSSIIQPYGSNGVVIGQINNQPITSIGLICTVSSGASLTYTVEITGDQVPSDTGNWNAHEVLVDQTESAQSNILYGVSGIRLNCNVWSSGTVTLGVVQWP